MGVAKRALSWTVKTVVRNSVPPMDEMSVTTTAVSVLSAAGFSSVTRASVVKGSSAGPDSVSLGCFSSASDVEAGAAAAPSRRALFTVGSAGGWSPPWPPLACPSAGRCVCDGEAWPYVSGGADDLVEGVGGTSRPVATLRIDVEDACVMNEDGVRALESSYSGTGLPYE